MGPRFWWGGPRLVKTSRLGMCPFFLHLTHAVALSWAGPCLLGQPKSLAICAILCRHSIAFIYSVERVRACLLVLGLAGGRDLQSLTLSSTNQSEFTSHLPLPFGCWSTSRGWWKAEVSSLMSSKLQTWFPHKGSYSHYFPSQSQNESGIWTSTSKLSLPDCVSQGWCYNGKINISPKARRAEAAEACNSFPRDRACVSLIFSFSPQR